MHYFSMKATLFILTAMITLMASCSSSQHNVEPSGGPCNYKEIDVLYTVVEVLENGYTVSIRPINEQDKTDFENSYTSKKISVEKEEGLNFTVGDTSNGKYTIMTSGSCGPDPRSIEIKPNVFVSVL